MNIISTIYPCKAYSTIIYHNYLGQYKYEIFSCRAALTVEKDRYYSQGGPSEKDRLNERKKAYEAILEDICKFYDDLELPAPVLKNDFLPLVVEVENKVCVCRNYEGLYDVDVKDMNRNWTLVKNLSYENAIERAKAIAALCNVK